MTLPRESRTRPRAGLEREQAVARQRALRGAVEQHRETAPGSVAARVRSAAPGTGTVLIRGAPEATSGAPDQPLKRRKINEPLVPPNPKEFDSAASIATLRAVFGT